MKAIADDVMPCLDQKYHKLEYTNLRWKEK